MHRFFYSRHCKCSAVLNMVCSLKLQWISIETLLKINVVWINIHKQKKKNLILPWLHNMELAVKSAKTCFICRYQNYVCVHCTTDIYAEKNLVRSLWPGTIKCRRFHCKSLSTALHIDMCWSNLVYSPLVFRSQLSDLQLTQIYSHNK